MKKTAVISGYATVDYAVRLPLPLNGAKTVEVERLAAPDWPRAGGATFFTGRRIAKAGHAATALVALGEDAHATLYRQACAAADVTVNTVACSPRLSTPWCMLLYHDDGSDTCLIERGNVDQYATAAALTIDIKQIDLLCIAAGTASFNAALLNSLPADVPLAWITKRDPVSFPVWLNERLSRRADIIFCNASERELINRSVEARKDRIIIETRGKAGVLLETSSARQIIPVQPIAARDTTGAGDTLAGEVLASLLDDATDTSSAVRRGIAATQRFLLERGTSRLKES